MSMNKHKKSYRQSNNLSMIDAKIYFADFSSIAREKVFQCHANEKLTKNFESQKFF
jgi:hypothetical protein